MDSTISDSFLLFFCINSKSPSLLIPNASLTTSWFWNLGGGSLFLVFFFLFSSTWQQFISDDCVYCCFDLNQLKIIEQHFCHCSLKSLTVLICTCYNCFMYPILVNMIISLYIQFLLALGKMNCCTVRFSTITALLYFGTSSSSPQGSYQNTNATMTMLNLMWADLHLCKICSFLHIWENTIW